MSKRSKILIGVFGAMLIPLTVIVMMNGGPRAYWMCIPEIARAITSCWISAVPSKMS